MKEDALFCVAQKAFIERDGEVLVLHDPVEGLDFPGGKIQEGEAKVGDVASLTDALKREVKEETGLEITVGEPFTVWYYEYPEGHRNFGKVIYLIGFKCRYVSGEVKLSTEHDSFRWVSRDNYRELSDQEGYFNALEKYFEGK